MKRLNPSSKQQLALSLEREPRHELAPDQRAALLQALADLLLEALGATAQGAPAETGETHEP